MTVDDFVKLLDSVTRFVTALSWPALLAFMLIRFGPALRNFFEDMGEFSICTAAGGPTRGLAHWEVL